MKKTLLALFALCIPLFMTACGRYDYGAHLSDVRSDQFLAETEEYRITLSCISREYPFSSDGVAAPRTDSIEIVLSPAVIAGDDYEIYVLGDSVWGGEMSFRNVTGDYSYSRGTDAFPEGSVSLRIVKNAGEATCELTATSIRNSATLSVDSALEAAISAEKKTVEALTYGGAFHGEFHVRLLRRDKNYYYAALVTGEKTISLLLDSESGAVLARRER